MKDFLGLPLREIDGVLGVIGDLFASRLCTFPVIGPKWVSVKGRGFGLGGLPAAPLMRIFPRVDLFRFWGLHNATKWCDISIDTEIK